MKSTFKDFRILCALANYAKNIFEVLEEFLCKMYGFNCTSVNKVRSKMLTKRFKQKERPPDLLSLPQCQSVLKYHMQWAAYVPKLAWFGFCG